MRRWSAMRRTVWVWTGGPSMLSVVHLTVTVSPALKLSPPRGNSTVTTSSQQGRGPRGADVSTSLPVGFTSLIAFCVGSESDSSLSASITASATGATQHALRIFERLLPPLLWNAARDRRRAARAVLGI